MPLARRAVLKGALGLGLSLAFDDDGSARADDPETARPQARVGEKAVIVAKISMREGFRITDSYRHRIIQLSPSDGVELERAIVPGSLQDGSIVFTVGVTPKTAGTHTVHGVFRFSYHNGGELDIRAAPFEATVTATE